MMSVSQYAAALINGVETPSPAVSTVRIVIQHEHFLRSINKWENYDSKCSAVVVGVKPLTLITAAHCLKEVKLISAKELPEIHILNESVHGISNAKLTQAFYRPYQEVTENLTLDIAVLVFDAVIDASVKSVVISQSQLSHSKSLLLCGYGKGHLEVDTIYPRCAERTFLFSFADFKQVMPLGYQSKDEMLYIKSEAQFNYTKELATTEGSLLAINRLNAEALYDKHLAMLTEGDSGGAWLTKDDEQNFSLVAITTLVERFYNQNIYWGFFNKDTPLADYPYIGYGLRLDTDAVLSFLKYCKNSGADLRFE